MADDSSDLSSLSSLSPVPSDDDEPAAGTILTYFQKLPKGELPKERENSPPPRKRSPSPPHETKFEDNQDIAVSKSVIYRVENASGRVQYVMA